MGHNGALNLMNCDPNMKKKLKQGNLNFSLIFSMFYRLAFLLLETRGEFYVETLFSMHVNR